MKDRVIQVLFLVIGLTLLYLAFRGQDFNSIYREILQADMSWFFVVFLVTCFGNLVRTFRWMLLIYPLNYKPKLGNTFLALMVGYFVNFAVPRLGEISRCYALRRSDGVPFNLSLGTVVAERLVDIFSLIMITVSALYFQYDLLYGFFEKYILTYFYNSLISKTTAFALLAFLFLCSLLIFYFFRKKILSNQFIHKIYLFLLDLVKGVISIFRMKNGWLFFLCTIIIWTCYFLSTYLWFKGFESTKHLGFTAGFALLVIGTVGRSVPVQGQGLGAYHFLVVKGLLLFGIAEVSGNALAMIIYLTQTCFYLVVGGICTLIFSLMYGKLKTTSEITSH